MSIYLTRDIKQDVKLEYSKEESVYEDIIIDIHDSLVLDINKYDITNGYILFFIGEYYEFKNINCNEMIKYYLMAIDKDNINAMNNLAMYYESIHDYDNTVKYYLMAIDKGCSSAMNNLGHYYFYDAYHDDDEMLKYFLMAIEYGNKTAMKNLGHYYSLISDFDNAKKYTLMGECD